MRNDAISEVLRAVADPARLALLRTCAERPQSVSELAAATAQAEPAVSRQLKQLADAGWLLRRRVGQRVQYSLDPSPAFAELRVAVLAALGVQGRPGAAARMAAPGDSEGSGAAADGRLARERIAALARLISGAPQGGLAVVLSERAAEFLPALASLRARVRVGVPTISARIATQSALRRHRIDAEVLLVGDLLQQIEPGEAAVLAMEGPVDSAAAWSAMLAGTRRLLASEGLLIARCDYGALERLVPGRAPPLALQRLLRDAGLDCRQLLPVEGEGRHELLACAALRSVAQPNEVVRQHVSDRASQ